MWTFVRLLVAAVLGSMAGSLIRHIVVQKDAEEAGELVIAATTTPILAGTLAGLVTPERGQVAVALIVSANVAANLKTEPVNAFIQKLMERQKAAKATG